MNLRGRDARAVNAFFNSVELTYDSIWTLEREGDYRKACEFNFRLPFTASRMSDEEREAYKGMFIKELIKSHSARWIITLSVWFAAGNKMYAEQRQVITSQCKINDVITIFEQIRDEAKEAGNMRNFLFYEWKSEVYKNQKLFETLDDMEVAA